MKRKILYTLAFAVPAFALVAFVANSYESDLVRFVSASVGGYAVGFLAFVVFMSTRAKK